jgi:sulfatase modifying factor 1
MKLKSVFLMVAFVTTAFAAQAVTIDLVPVGNPGNANDTRYETPGYGSVADVYAIGKYEITAGQYCEFLNAVADADDYGLYSTSMWSSDYGCKIERIGASPNYSYNVAADRADRPVNYVSWGDAARFCNWLHNGQPTGAQGLATTEDGAYYLNGATSQSALMAVVREADAQWWIPSENEWYKAAYHKNDGVTGNYWDYPTGTNMEPSNDLINPDPGNNANFYQDGYTIGSPYFTTVVGEFENSESPYDTFDQGGNLLEWNETTVTSSSRGLRGGYWYYYSDLLHASNRGNRDPTIENGTVGFRVASVPEPGSITLLVCCAILGLIWWRRRK